MFRLPTIRVLIGIVTVAILASTAPAETTIGVRAGLLRMNDVTIMGGRHVAVLRPEMSVSTGFVRLRAAITKDGLDEIVFRDSSDSLRIVWGEQIILYTRDITRVNRATYNGQPVQIILIDDENTRTDPRPGMTRDMAILVTGIVLAGLVIGIVIGLQQRRGFAGKMNDPLLDRALFGLAAGFVAALLVFGLSGRGFYLDNILKPRSDQHLAAFVLPPPATE